MYMNTIYQNRSFVIQNTTFPSTRISDLIKAFKLVKITFEIESIDRHSKLCVTEMKYR